MVKTTVLELRILEGLNFVTATLPDGVTGEAYSVQIVVSGGAPPYRFSSDSLPLGLTLDSDGLVSGTPQEAGVFAIEVKVEDSAEVPF